MKMDKFDSYVSGYAEMQGGEKIPENTLLLFRELIKLCDSYEQKGMEDASSGSGIVFPFEKFKEDQKQITNLLYMSYLDGYTAIKEGLK